MLSFHSKENNHRCSIRRTKPSKTREGNLPIQRSCHSFEQFFLRKSTSGSDMWVTCTCLFLTCRIFKGSPFLDKWTGISQGVKMTSLQGTMATKDLIKMTYVDMPPVWYHAKWIRTTQSVRRLTVLTLSLSIFLSKRSKPL